MLTLLAVRGLAGYIRFMSVVPMKGRIVVRIYVGRNAGVNRMLLLFYLKLWAIVDGTFTADCGRCLNYLTSIGFELFAQALPVYFGPESFGLLCETLLVAVFGLVID
jgi:hypothetical protein